jgi:Glycosyl transferase 4-like domain
MKVLVLSALAPPINSPESIQAGRYISRLENHSVTLVSATVRNAWEPVDHSLDSLVKRTRRRIERRMPPSLLMRLWGRLDPEGPFPDPYAPFHWRAESLLDQLDETPDIILSRSTPFSSHVLAYACVKHFKCPWIMHLSDPVSDNPFHHFSPSRHQKLAAWEEKCFSLADIITVTSSKTMAHYQAKHPAWRDKFRLLPNVFDEKDMNLAPVTFSGPMKLTFTGRLYGPRNAGEWIRAVELAAGLRSDLVQNISVEFAGHLDEGSMDRIRASTAPNVHLLGPLSMTEVRKVQAAASLLVSIDTLDEDARSDMFFPSKLTDYLAANRQIIALARRTSTTHEVVQGRFGWCFDHDNLHELPALLVEASQAYRDRNAAFFSPQGDPMEYSLGRHAPRLLQMINETLA